MQQITAEQFSAELGTIFDRINRNREVFSVIRNKNQAVVVMDAEDYRRLAGQNHFSFSEESPRTSPDPELSDDPILSALRTGRIAECCCLIREQEKTGKKHPLSEAAEKAAGIMKQHSLTDKDTGQAFAVLRDLLGEHGIRSRSADFSLETYKGTERIQCLCHLDMPDSERLPALKAELNIRLSALPSRIFEALEIDITADGADSLCMSGDISGTIAANGEMMQRIHEAAQGMREGIPGLSYKEVFGE